MEAVINRIQRRWAVADKQWLYGLLTAVNYLMCLFALVTGIVYRNGNLPFGIVAGIVLLIIVACCFQKLDVSCPDSVVVAVAFCLPILLSVCAFPSFPESTTLSTRWVVTKGVGGPRIGEIGGYTWAIPFVEEIQGVTLDQSIGRYGPQESKDTKRWKIRGRTKDGIDIQATVNAAFALTDEPTKIMALAQKERNADAYMESQLRQALEVEFQRIVTRIDSTDLKPSFMLDLRVGQFDRIILKDLPVKPNGEVAITDIHPYFSE